MENQKNVTLNNCLVMPVVGLGVFRLEDPAQAQKAVETALEVGYRHIDTASYYFNEEAVGKAIRNSGIPRSEIFVTTKVWNQDQRNGRVREAFEESLQKLGTDYIDLYLIHWPVPGKYRQSWKVLEGIYQSGKAKAIGVSNFKQLHLEELKETAEVVPAVNQIELHPYLIQQSDLEYCRKENIVVEAWSPLGAGKTNLLRESILTELADKYGKSPAQIILRWDYQRGVVTIPKSSNRERMIENLSIFDFSLTEEEIVRINSLNKDLRLGPDPDHIDF